jgi:NDP-sugar pyrophosphorylase family protein
MIVTELSKGTKLYLLVGGKGERLSSVTNGTPKPLVEINGKYFINYVLDDLKGFDVTLVCSDSTYDYFKNFDIDIFNEGDRVGTGGFLMKLGENVPDSFYIMNGDTYFTGDLNLDVEESTIFVAEELVTDDVGYIRGRKGKVEEFVEKNPFAKGKELVSVGIYKFYKKDITLPMRLPISIEYDILPNMELKYKVLNTVKFDIGTPERLEKFKTWLPT